MRDILVPIVAFGLRSELWRVMTLLKGMGLAKKFEIKPGYFKYVILRTILHNNCFVDPLCLFYSDRTARFAFPEGDGIEIILKEYDSIFLSQSASTSLWAEQNYTCQYCGGIAEHIDHVTPLSRGGKCGHHNFALSCQTCNLKKHDKTPHEANMPLMSDWPQKIGNG